MHTFLILYLIIGAYLGGMAHRDGVYRKREGRRPHYWIGFLCAVAWPLFVLATFVIIPLWLKHAKKNTPPAAAPVAYGTGTVPSSKETP